VEDSDRNLTEDAPVAGTSQKDQTDGQLASRAHGDTQDWLARTARDIGPALFVVAVPCVTFWFVLLVLDMCDWGLGVPRAIVLLGTAVVVPSLARIRPVGDRRVRVLLCILAAALAVTTLWRAGSTVIAGIAPAVDIGRTTIGSVELRQAGIEPYVVPVDSAAAALNPGGTGLGFFGGFKYGPAMTWAVTPAVQALGARGYHLMNGLALVLLATSVGFWLRCRRPAADRPAAVRASSAWIGAVALVLLPGFLVREVFLVGVNDLLPVSLGLLSFALRDRGMAVAAGVALAVSFGMKPFPALLYSLPLLLMAGRRPRFAASVAIVSLALYLPPLVSSPRELLANVFVFNLVRPTDSTSLVHVLPQWLGILVRAAGTMFAVVWFASRSGRDRSPGAIATVVGVGIAVLLASGAVIHRNYLLWLLPFLAVATAARCWNGTSHPGPPDVSTLPPGGERGYDSRPSCRGTPTISSGPNARSGSSVRATSTTGGFATGSRRRCWSRAGASRWPRTG
jgi:hypothetical protein